MKLFYLRWHFRHILILIISIFGIVIYFRFFNNDETTKGHTPTPSHPVDDVTPTPPVETDYVNPTPAVDVLTCGDGTSCRFTNEQKNNFMMGLFY